MRYSKGQSRRGERGQVLIESVIVLPVMIFLVLGALQLVMVQHGRVMTEYAAYNATRAGIVHDANWNVMRNAAMLSTLPLYERTDSTRHFLRAWAKMELLTEATELVDTAGATVEAVVSDLLGVDVGGFLPDVSLVEVDVTSPTDEDFRRAFAWQRQRSLEALGHDPYGPLRYPNQEIDFDDREMLASWPRAGRLAVEVRVLYPLEIPVVGWIFFQMWYAQTELRAMALTADIGDWAAFEARVESGQTLEQLVADSEGTQVFDDWLVTRQRTKEARLLRELASRRQVYLLPLRASYAMQMQSNPFFENRREPVWFSLSD